MSREILRLPTNTPTVVSLAFDDGIEVEGKYGQQMLYTVRGQDDNEYALYVPIQVRELLDRQNIGKGQPFRIGKFEVVRGNRRTVEWKVARLDPEEPAPMPRQPESGSPGQSNQQYTDRPHATMPVTLPAPRPPAPPAAAANGAGYQPPPQTQPQSQTTFAGRADSQFILSSLVNMTDICAAAESYAKARGMDIHYGAEDIRALTITCFIQATRGGGR